MARILFVNPPNVPFSNPGILIEPIDLLTLATFTRRLGHDVQVLDMNRRRMSAADFEGGAGRDGWDFMVVPLDYHIPLFSSAALPEVRALAEAAGRRGIRVISGGKMAARFPERLISAPGIVVVNGEMEAALVDLLAPGAWDAGGLRAIPGIFFWNGSRLAGTAPRTVRVALDALPIPDRELVELDDYIDVRTMLTSRGCSERCAFCPVRPFWGPWRSRSPRLVADEIELLITRHAAAKILFLDDHSTVSGQRMREIAQEIMRRNARAALGCLATPQSFQYDTFALMHRAGFRWVHFGAESGDQRVLDGLKKGSRVPQIRSAIQGAKELGYRVRTSWIADAEPVDAHSLAATAKLILETEPDEVRIHFLTKRAGSALFEKSPGAELPEQYLHRSAGEGPNAAHVRHMVNSLTATLSDRGYLITGEDTDWEALARAQGAPRFVAFAAARYGIGWQL